MNKLITKQLLATYKCVKGANGWVSAQEIAEDTGLQKSTTNRHLAYLVEGDVLEVLKSMTFYLYRMSEREEASEVKQELDSLLTALK